MSISQDDLNKMVNNPTRAMNTVINEIEQSWFNGEAKLNSKTHPAVFCMDLIIGTTYSYINELQDAVSATFPKHARTLTDLSKNMADEERAGIIAEPSSTTVDFNIQTEVLKNIAVPVVETDGSSVYSKLLIPKDTIIDILGYQFILENGVEIRYNERTGYQCVLDSTTVTPFNPIETNLLNRRLTNIRGTEYLKVSIPVRQLSCKPLENLASTKGTGCSGEFNYTNNFYGVRAFFTRDGVKREINVTYDEDVFDNNSLTLTLKLDTVNKVIGYTIPDTYIVSGLGVGTLDIYTYTTLGELTKDLRSTEASKIKVGYYDYRFGVNNLNPYSAPLKNTGGVVWTVAEMVTGGDNPDTFLEMKSSVIQGRKKKSLPITDNELAGKMEDYDYGVVKSVDYLTGRQYSVTKELPVQTNKKIYGNMNTFVGSQLTSVSELIGSGLCYDNISRVTLPSNVLFNISNTVAELVGSDKLASYNGYSPEQKVKLCDENNLVYTPFYYIFDVSGSQVILNTYHLDNPKITDQTFLSENTSLGFEVGVGAISIVKTGADYVLRIKTKSGNGYKDLQDDRVGLQVSFNSSGSTQLASISADIIGVGDDGERVWEVILESNLDVDGNDVLYLTNLTQFGEVRERTGVNLIDEVYLIFTTVGEDNAAKTETDKNIDQTLFDQTMKGIVETRYQLDFGKKMNTLYSRVRPVAGGLQYQTYAVDIPDTYDTDVFLYEDGKLVIVDGKAVLLHKAGNVRYYDDEETIPYIKHEAGSLVRDEEGKPIVLSTKELMYHFDFVAFDGVYYFTNDSYDIEFAQGTKDYFTDVVDKDMSVFNSWGLDGTDIYFQPKNKTGYRNVIINNNAETVLRQDIAFTVTYYLTKNGFKNNVLKESLTSTTPKTINELLLNNRTLSVSELVGKLKDADANGDIVDIKVSASSGSSVIDVISSMDDMSGFSVQRGLTAGSDNLLSVKENVDISFLTHDKSIKEY